MKVLLVSTFETKGGAAVACHRLLHALLKSGIDAKMLVQKKQSDDPFVLPLKRDKSYQLHFLWERLIVFINNRFSRKNLFKVSLANAGTDITGLSEFKEADIIHLHWINQGLLSLKDLQKIIQSGKPVFWTMHDMWPVTGICHHSGICENYRLDCGHCHLLNTPSSKDLSYKVLKNKKAIFQNAGIQFIACSDWLRLQAEKSILITGNLLTNIPNPIDTTLFSPGDSIRNRTELGLPLDKKLILFGAYSISDKLKGIDYLLQSTHLLRDLNEEVELVFMGEEKEEIRTEIGLKAHFMGYISDTEKLVQLYQSVDCYVTPSLQENLPNMIMEAMACGIPCVGFHIGGIPEMISHLHTGYVATYQSPEDLSEGIRYVLAHSKEPNFKKANRDFILSNYSERTIADRYIQLYHQALSLQKTL